MAYEKKNGDTVLFKNNKEKDTQPDITGELLWEGKVIKLAYWAKKGEKGTFYAGKAELKQEKPKEPAKDVSNEEDETLPF